MDAKQAESYLRDIHAIMERSTKYSTLSGLSGIVAGLAAIVGAVLSRFVCRLEPDTPGWMYEHRGETFLLIWLGVLMTAAVADIVFTKRKARKIGKRFFDHPMRRVIVALIPGVACGLAITVYLYDRGAVFMVPAFWMIFYGLALVSVSQISMRELLFMGCAFVVAGIFTLFAAGDFPFLMMGVSFGGFHLVYGTYMWIRYGD